MINFDLALTFACVLIVGLIIHTVIIAVTTWEK